jgi:membrane protease YdiL (CAAX protease family)
MAAIVTAAYLAAPIDPATTVAQWSRVAGDVPEGWFRDRLAIRLARAADDPALGRTAEARLAARAAPLLARIRAINVAMVALVAAGVVSTVVAFRRRRAGFGTLRVARAPLPPPWRGRTGFAVLARGAALAGLLSVGMSLLTRVVHLDESMTDASLSVLMTIPFLVFVSRWLLAPAGLDFRGGFGLSPVPGGVRPLALTLSMLIAAGIVLDFGFTLIGDWRGWSAHWTEWFEAPLAWGRPAVVGASLFSLVVGAPVLEELIFRGLIFGTLRRRFSVTPSAVISAGVFAVAHGYGTSGTASVFASGVLWAVAYECTGSLLPTMLAHAASNLMTAVVLMVLLR